VDHDHRRRLRAAEEDLRAGGEAGAGDGDGRAARDRADSGGEGGEGEDADGGINPGAKVGIAGWMRASSQRICRGMDRTLTSASYDGPLASRIFRPALIPAYVACYGRYRQRNAWGDGTP
jgi:hypothetical protein